MKRVVKESLRFYLLVALIIISLIQLGILWNYQSYGFPFTFLGQKVETSADIEKRLGEECIQPLRIVVSNGYEAPRWVVSDRKDADYNRLWGYAVDSLKEAMDKAPLQTAGISLWKDATANRSLIFEFKVNLKANLLELFLQPANLQLNGLTGITKLSVSSWNDTNASLYITDGVNTSIYTINMTAEKSRYYEDVFERYNENGSLRSFRMMQELNTNDSFNFKFDEGVLGIPGTQYSSFKTVSLMPAPGIYSQDPYTSAEVSEIASSILGVEKDGYDRTVDSVTNTIEFRTQNKIYSLKTDGVLEYNSLTGISDSDKGTLKSAFVHVYKLLSGINSLISEDSQLFLSGIDESKKDRYVFYFDYIVDGMPVILEAEDDEAGVDHAVRIESNSKGLIYCNAVIKGFKIYNQEEPYDVYFGHLMDDLYKNYPELKNGESLRISDMFLAYGAGRKLYSSYIKPVWVIEISGKHYVVSMRAE